MEESTKPEIKWTTAEDRVVSEVNNFLTEAPSLITPILKPTNKIAKLGFTLPNANAKCSTSAMTKEDLKVDSDGDLILRRSEDSATDSDFMLIEYENATTINLVGLQVWRGAFLLSDFVLHFATSYFKDKIVLEFGSGTGLVGIVSAIFAKKVILTGADLDEPSIQNLLKANVSHNKKHCKAEIEIESLDFTNLGWSSQLEQNVQDADVFLAADVVYHVDITSAFVRTLKKIVETSSSTRTKDIFIAMEKRYVFTISDLDSCSPMYGHFLEELDNQLNLSPGCMPRIVDVVAGAGACKMELSMSAVPLDFPQYFNYERVKQLVLFHIQIKPV